MNFVDLQRTVPTYFRPRSRLASVISQEVPFSLSAGGTKRNNCGPPISGNSVTEVEDHIRVQFIKSQMGSHIAIHIEEREFQNSGLQGNAFKKTLRHSCYIYAVRFLADEKLRIARYDL